ncbi:MAG: hypothetical protein IKO55_11995 [Kiritimatiellae bacterium]|nr:hypothetical protein [Kiritimatiellia bacterium]
MQNPFRYGTKVTGGSFYDRREIKASMLNVIGGCNNAVLYGPRRYGKSSLVAEIIEELSSEGVLCVYMNMMDIASLGDFIVAYSKAVALKTAPVASMLKHLAGIFKRVRPVLCMGEDGKLELTLSFSASKPGTAELREALVLPEKLRPSGKRMLIVIDEFQEVAELGLGANFERVMRSVIENHTEISYVFLGSKTHLLKRMFAKPSRPFYRSAQIFSLGLPPPDESREFIAERFKSVGMKLSAPAAQKMTELSGNVPYYLQALGSWVFRSVSERGGREVREADVIEGYDQMYAAERDLCESLFRQLPESQRLVARALAVEPTGKFTADYRECHFLPTLSTVSTAVRRLVEDSQIDFVEGVYRLVDPLFAHHLRKTAGA